MAAIDPETRGERWMESAGRVVALPDIKMRPKESMTVAKVLAACDEEARGHYVFLMEQWDRSGHVVGTTPQSITLGAPCAE